MMQVHRGVLAKIFIATSFTLTEMWEQPKCPTVGNMLKKLWYIHRSFLKYE